MKKWIFLCIALILLASLVLMVAIFGNVNYTPTSTVPSSESASSPGTSPTTVPSPEPGSTEPVITDPSTEPTSTEPVVTDPSTEPTSTEPVITEPSTEPSSTEPVVTEPSTEPTSTEPVVTEPSTEPTSTEPVVTKPSTEPTSTEPVVTEPSTEPTSTEPVVTEPTEPEPVVPTTIHATVSGDFFVGDALERSDFTIKVTMNNGTVLKNPDGWTASTMELTSTSNKITVTYQGVSSTVTVKAEPVVPTKITATVSGDFFVGDTLDRSHFTIKVTMNNGTVLKNPDGWTASTMELTSTSNKITVTYQGVSSTVTVKAEPVVPTKITATVSGDFFVGDTLERSDFTIKVTMNNGTVLKNPDGWTASTMELTSTSNKITVTYQGVSSTVTVKANPGPVNGMELVKEAMRYIGLPYVHGGNSLTSGTDCSGFTKLIFQKYGYNLPRTASDQHSVGTIITEDEALPGDLLVVTYDEGSYYTGHAGIYLGYGMMISAMPGDGVIIGSVHSGMDYIRVYDNTYLGTDDDAYFEGLEHLITLGHVDGYNTCNVNWYSGTATLSGDAPNGNKGNRTLKLKIHNPEEGYESLLEAWKKIHLAKQCYFFVTAKSDSGSILQYSYWQGQWYLTSELNSKVDNGELTNAAINGTDQFYGAFWNSNAVITNGRGEIVDLTTCPGITAENYAAIAKPGDPNEGAASRLPYIPDGLLLCKEHRFYTVSKNKETQEIVSECRKCGYQVIDSTEVKDHAHTLHAEYWYGGWFEDSEIIYECLHCAYRESYVIDPVTGADHDHDYSYTVITVEPTCCMDGYTLHQCICGVSYKDQIVECEGHDYGPLTTVAPTYSANGYDLQTCLTCGHIKKDNFKKP